MGKRAERTGPGTDATGKLDAWTSNGMGLWLRVGSDCYTGTTHRQLVAWLLRARRPGTGSELNENIGLDLDLTA